MLWRQLEETVELQPDTLRRDPGLSKNAGGHGLPLVLEISQLGPQYEEDLTLDLCHLIQNRVIQHIRIDMDAEQGDFKAANLIAKAIHKRRREIEIVEVVMRPPTMHATIAFLRQWPFLVSKLDAHHIDRGLIEFKSEIASLPNLTELGIDPIVAGPILLEFTHQGKPTGLKKLLLEDHVGPELGPFLASPSASSLRMLSLERVGLGTLEMERLTEGLLQNCAITELKLSFSNRARRDASGLPILADFFRHDSSIRKLTLGGVGPGNRRLQDENLIDALACNSTITELESVNMFGSADSGVTLTRFLRSNQQVESLRLYLQEDSLHDEAFGAAFAQGLSQNTSVRRLEFSCVVVTHRTVNLCGVFQTLAFRPQPCQLKALSIDMDSLSSNSLLELCRYLENPNCQLQSLKCEETTFEVQDLPYEALIDAVHQSPALKQFQLRIYYSTTTLVKLALLGSRQSTTVTRLWIELEREDVLEETELEEAKEQVLEWAMTNTKLEGLVLKLWDLSYDIDFQKRLNSICTRNKVITKANRCLRNGTFPPSLLAKTLVVIEKECQLLDESTLIYFNTLLFAFLTGRSNEASKYFRSKAIGDSQS